MERTETMDVSESGLRFWLQAAVDPGAIVALGLAGGQPERSPAGEVVMFQVVWAAPHGDGRQVGAQKLQAGNLWPMNFPKRHEQRSP